MIFAMRNILILTILAFSSCQRSFYGIYNTKHWNDQAIFFQLKFNTDTTVEKTEVHTISDFTTGRYTVMNAYITCYFDSSKNNFPPDTALFKIKGEKLFFIKDGVLKRKHFLKKQ
jgi:hypothetical protein